MKGEETFPFWGVSLIFYMISEFVVSVKTGNMIAIYHALYFEVLFVTEDEYENVMRGNVSEDEKKILYEHKIYTGSAEEDKERLTLLKNADRRTSGKADVLYLILSSDCNLRCKYCMVKEGGYSRQNMSVEILRKTLKLYEEYLQRQKIALGKIVFYGGEPLVSRELFITALEEIKRFKVPCRIELVTNGTLIDEEISELIKKYDIQAAISLDGPEYLNDINRVYANGKGTYGDVIKNIRNLQKKNIMYGLSLVFSADTADDSGEFFEWVKSGDICKNYNVNLYHYNDFDENWKKDYTLLLEQLMKFYDVCVDHELYEQKLYRRIQAVEKKEPIFSDCAAMGGNQLVVFSDGKAGVCHVERGSGDDLPNILDYESIEEILLQPALEKWKYITNLSNDECCHCEAFFLCGGGCYRQKEILKFPAHDETFCMYAKSLSRWFLRKMYETLCQL